jgi:hypothetical protein
MSNGVVFTKSSRILLRVPRIEGAYCDLYELRGRCFFGRCVVGPYSYENGILEG